MPPPSTDLRARVERLEAVVADLHDTVAHLAKQATVPPVAPRRRVVPGPVAPTPRPTKTPSFELPDAMRSSEYWLSRLGIGLLLFGLAFLFKYSIDQGWLTPTVRIGFGVALGAGLLAGGLWLSGRRRHFSQILLGGSIATFYITTYATFAWFDLIGYVWAFRLMIGVTLLAFLLAVIKDGVVLAIVGTLGGLATPFVLHTDTANIPGLMVYTSVVLSGALGAFFFKGWRTLLGVAVVGGWAVVASAVALLAYDAPLAERWAVQGGIIFGLLSFGLVPLVRHAVAAQAPEAWPSPAAVGSRWTWAALLHNRYLHLLALSTPLITLGLSTSTWTLPSAVWGWVTLGGAALYGLGAWGLSQHRALASLAYTHALVGALLLTLALVFLLDGEALLFAIATEAVVLHFLAHRLEDRGLRGGAHGLFAVLALVVAAQLGSADAANPPVFNAWALATLWAIGAGAACAYVLRARARAVYLGLAHIFFLAWLLRELSPLPEGQAFVTISWGVYTLTLLMIGLRKRLSTVRLMAMGTLLLVIGKLFLVDLAELEAIWRILLFLGFGAVLLGVSYYVQNIWGEPDATDPDAAERAQAEAGAQPDPS